MQAVVSKAELEALLAGRFDAPPGIRQRIRAETLSTGIPEVDTVLGGVPRGAITEVFGPPSSGRTGLCISLLARAAGRGEVCALVDTADTLDPVSAAAGGVNLDGLLWVRCGGDARRSLAVTDLLLAAGGFGVVVLDLAEMAPKTARRIPLAAWYRFRRWVENTPAALVVLGREPCTGACATLALEMGRQGVTWSGALLRGARWVAQPRKPAGSAGAAFEARAAG